jgi:hypothetical protein
MTESILAYLDDVAQLTGVRIATLRSTDGSGWRARVRDGRLPAPMPNHKRPTWVRRKLIAFLEDDVAQAPTPAGRARIVETASTGAAALLADLMADNHDDAA